jgi:hypothetical protein
MPCEGERAGVRGYFEITFGPLGEFLPLDIER